MNAKDKITTLDPSSNRDVFCFYGLKQQSAVLCQADELEENWSLQLFTPHFSPGIHSEWLSQSPCPSLHGWAELQHFQSASGIDPSQKMLNKFTFLTSRLFLWAAELQLFIGLLGDEDRLRKASEGTFWMLVLSQMMSENFLDLRCCRALSLKSWSNPVAIRCRLVKYNYKMIGQILIGDEYLLQYFILSRMSLYLYDWRKICLLSLIY